MRSNYDVSSLCLVYNDITILQTALSHCVQAAITPLNIHLLPHLKRDIAPFLGLIKNSTQKLFWSVKQELRLKENSGEASSENNTFSLFLSQ